MEEDNDSRPELEVGSRVRFRRAGIEGVDRDQVLVGTVVDIFEFEDMDGNEEAQFVVRTDDGAGCNGEYMRDVEEIMSPLEWSRAVFPQFCRDVVEGNVADCLKLTSTRDNINEVPRGRYTGVSFHLDDEMAAALGQAIGQSTHLRVLDLWSRETRDLSINGVDDLARGIASSRSLQSLKLFDFAMDEDQVQVDIICRRLRESSTIKCLYLKYSSLPQRDAFRELCKSSSIDYLEICNGFESDNAFEKELYRFSGLKKIGIEICSCPFVKECLDGLVDHPFLDNIYLQGVGDNSFQQILPALDRFLESREKKASWLSLELGSQVQVNPFLDIIAQRDALKHLNLGDAVVDKNGATKLQTLLKTSSNLRTLILPYLQGDCQYANEGLVNMLGGVQRSNSLSELSIATTVPETIFSMLKGNTTLRTLLLYGCREDDSDDDFDFEGLKNMHGLQRLDVSFLLSRSFRSIDRQTLIAALKVNATLQEIICGEGHEELANDERINFHLRLNRWFNRHSPDILRAPESVSDGMWPFILARVSSNTNALHWLVRGYPGMNK